MYQRGFRRAIVAATRQERSRSRYSSSSRHESRQYVMFLYFGFDLRTFARDRLFGFPAFPEGPGLISFAFDVVEMIGGPFGLRLVQQ